MNSERKEKQISVHDLQMQAEVIGKWRRKRVGTIIQKGVDLPLYEKRTSRTVRVIDRKTGDIHYLSLHEIPSSVDPAEWPHVNKTDEVLFDQIDIPRPLSTVIKIQSVTHPGIDVDTLFRGRGGNPSFPLDKSGGRAFHETDYRVPKIGGYKFKK